MTFSSIQETASLKDLVGTLKALWDKKLSQDTTEVLPSFLVLLCSQWWPSVTILDQAPHGVGSGLPDTWERGQSSQQHLSRYQLHRSLGWWLWMTVGFHLSPTCSWQRQAETGTLVPLWGVENGVA